MNDHRPSKTDRATGNAVRRRKFAAVMGRVGSDHCFCLVRSHPLSARDRQEMEVRSATTSVRSECCPLGSRGPERTGGFSMKTDRRFRQANFEALCSVALALLFFLWWYGFAYGLGEKDPSLYRRVCGLPDWFFYSSVLGPALFCALAWLMVKFLFKPMSLAPHEKEDVRHDR